MWTYWLWKALNVIWAASVNERERASTHPQHFSNAFNDTLAITIERKLRESNYPRWIKKMNDFIDVIDMRINTRNAITKWSGRNRKLEKSVNKTVSHTVKCENSGN